MHVEDFLADGSLAPLPSESSSSALFLCWIFSFTGSGTMNKNMPMIFIWFFFFIWISPKMFLRSYLVKERRRDPLHICVLGHYLHSGKIMLLELSSRFTGNTFFFNDPKIQLNNNTFQYNIKQVHREEWTRALVGTTWVWINDYILDELLL